MAEEREQKQWPSDVAQIYGEIANEDRQLEEAMFEGIRTTWPISPGSPGFSVLRWHMSNLNNLYETLRPLGLKPLNKAWAKIEILLGLACIYLGVLGATQSVYTNRIIPMILFILGGYLAMAGHRSHIYQSNNLLTAFLVEEIRKTKE